MFRNQIVAVAATAIVMIVWAILIGSFAPLAGLAVLLPVCGAFLLADHHVVENWRTDLLRSWTAGDLEFEAYRAAIRANPVLPKATLEGMLATLPSADTLPEERQIGAAARRAIALRLLMKHDAERKALAAKTAAGTLAACSMIIAAGLRRWEPMLGLVAVPLTLWLGRSTAPPTR